VPEILAAKDTENAKDRPSDEPQIAPRRSGEAPLHLGHWPREIRERIRSFALGRREVGVKP